MKIDATRRENISALLDNELTDAQLDIALTNLIQGHVTEKQTWEIYHQIGDVLRSDDLSVQLTHDFSSRFSALLDAEPAILAPQRKELDTNITPPGKFFFTRYSRYFTMTSVAAAAVMGFMLAPQISPYVGGDHSTAVQLSQAPRTQINDRTIQLVADGAVAEAKVRPVEQIEMLRDPRLDSYLQAHLKFSPSIANGAQFATHANGVYVMSGAPVEPVAPASLPSYVPEK